MRRPSEHWKKVFSIFDSLKVIKVERVRGDDRGPGHGLDGLGPCLPAQPALSSGGKGNVPVLNIPEANMGQVLTLVTPTSIIDSDKTFIQNPFLVAKFERT